MSENIQPASPRVGSLQLEITTIHIKSLRDKYDKGDLFFFNQVWIGGKALGHAL